MYNGVALDKMVQCQWKIECGLSSGRGDESCVSLGKSFALVGFLIIKKHEYKNMHTKTCIHNRIPTQVLDYVCSLCKVFVSLLLFYVCNYICMIIVSQAAPIGEVYRDLHSE